MHLWIHALVGFVVIRTATREQEEEQERDRLGPPLRHAFFAWWAWAKARARGGRFGRGGRSVAGGETQRWLFESGATHSLGRPDYLPLPLPMPAKQKGKTPANASSQKLPSRGATNAKT